MQSGDFRFPIPEDAHVTQLGSVKGNFDTAEGLVEVERVDGKPVDAEAYANVLRRNQFDVVQTPWQFEARSIKPRGGRVSVDAFGPVITIRFSYFGDY
jgi:hypothetical protein